MRTRYALAALGLFCAPAIVQAQNLDTQDRIAGEDTLTIDNQLFPSTHNAPQFTVNAPENLQRSFYQGVDLDEAFADPYFVPDFETGNGSLVVGASVYGLPIIDVDDDDGDGMNTDTLAFFDYAPPVFDPGTTPGAVNGVVTDPETGVTYAGNVTGTLVQSQPIEGCVDETVGSTFDNADEIEGNIAFVSRGSCNFSTKTLAAYNAGAIGIVIYIPNNEVYTDNRAAINMSAGTWFEMLEDSVSVNIPAIIIPNGVAQAILDEIDFGAEVEVTLGASPVNPFIDADGDGNIDDDDGAMADFTPVRGTINVESRPLSLGVQPIAIEDIVLEQGVTAMKAYPNPTAGLARVALTTATPEVVRVEVYNTLGQRVAVLHDGMVNAQVDLDFDGSQLATGLYLVRATGETFRQTTRVTVAR